MKTKNHTKATEQREVEISKKTQDNSADQLAQKGDSNAATLQEKRQYRSYVLLLVTVIINIVLAGLTIGLFILAWCQFEEGKIASNRLMSNIEKSSSSMKTLGHTMDLFQWKMDTTLQDFKKRTEITLQGFSEYLRESNKQFSHFQEVQNKYLTTLEQERAIRELDISRKPLVILTANDVRVEPMDSSITSDSVLSVNFRFKNYGDKATEEPRAFVVLPEGYKIFKTQNDVYVTNTDSNAFRVYCSQTLPWGSPDLPYSVAIDARVWIRNTKGKLHKVLEPFVNMFVAEREPYNYFLIIDRASSGDWVHNAFIDSELEKVRGRQEKHNN